MLTEQSGIFSGALAVAAKAFGIWLVAWAIRRKGELDYQMDSVAILIRWSIVVASFLATARFGQLNWWVYRSIALAIGLAFLCWPNFAYHLSRLIRGQSSTTE